MIAWCKLAGTSIVSRLVDSLADDSTGVCADTFPIPGRTPLLAVLATLASIRVR